MRAGLARHGAAAELVIIRTSGDRDRQSSLREIGGKGVFTKELEDALIEERNAARKRRDFKRSDEIRQQLADSGIIVEDTKDGGVRWKYK